MNTLQALPDLRSTLRTPLADDLDEPEIHVLLVDDGHDDAKHFQRALTSDGARSYIVTVAEAAHEAMAKLRVGSFDVIVLDLHLPDSTGLTTLQRLAESAPEVPIVVSSSLDDEQLALQAMRYGAQDYIVKWPDDPKVLTHSLRYSIERKGTEHALQQYALDLKRSNAELEQFAYVVSHDLREPLRMVSSYASLLGEEYGDKLDDEARTYIHYATDGARRMGELIEHLLDYSRVGRKDATPQAVPLDEVLQAVVGQLRVAIEESGAEVDIHPLPTVQGNPTRLLQLFQNLITNSLKFRSNDPPRITVNWESDGAAARIQVRDNGIGIEPEFHDRIFQIFHRLHTREEYPGTGIGLAMCRKIAEQHGGRITVDSQADRGATFYVTLPLSRRLPRNNTRHVSC